MAGTGKSTWPKKIRGLKSKKPPQGFIDVEDAWNILRRAKLPLIWAFDPYVKRLPYYIPKSREEIRRRRWEPNKYLPDRYSEARDSLRLPKNDLAKARRMRNHFVKITNQLQDAVQRNKVGIRLRTIDGILGQKEIPPGLVDHQWDYVLEFGRVRIRPRGESEQLAFVYFNEKAVQRLSKGKSAQLIHSSLTLTEKECITIAKDAITTLIASAMPGSKEAPTFSWREIWKFVDKVLRKQGGMMPRTIFLSKIWGTDKQPAWYDAQGYKKMGGRQKSLAAADRRKLINAHTKEKYGIEIRFD